MSKLVSKNLMNCKFYVQKVGILINHYNSHACILSKFFTIKPLCYIAHAGHTDSHWVTISTC